MQRQYKESISHLSCEQTKKELSHAIDYENRRSNEDNAKKRAVTQHMDYEGFRQMVLGAHIHPLKSNELNSFSINANGERVLNPTSITFSNVKSLDEKVEISSPSMDKSFEISTFRAFRNFFKEISNEKEEENKAILLMTFLESQSKENLHKVFSYDFDPAYFVEIMKIFKGFSNAEDKRIRVQKWIMIMRESKDFNSVIPKFLSKSEKSEYNDFIEKFEIKENI